MPKPPAGTGRDEQAAYMVGQSPTLATEQRLVIAGQPRQVATARAFVRRLTGERHPCAERIALLTSELVTNSIKHSDSGKPGGAVTLTVTVFSDRVRVEVLDAGGVTLPMLRCSENMDENGRGLRLVDAYSLKWDYHPAETGMVTWFECALDDLPLSNGTSGLAATPPTNP